MLFWGSIPIVYKWSKDAKNKDKDIKAKIYYITLKTMLQRIYSTLSSIQLRKWNINNVTILLDYKNDI